MPMLLCANACVSAAHLLGAVMSKCLVQRVSNNLCSRWVAVRARGGKARYSGDSYTFAHTTPVYFTDALPNDASRASADFLAAVIEEIWRRVDQRDAWLVPEDREVYRRHLDEALARLTLN